MLRRRRLIQLFLGAVIFICYIQFQLFSYTERRLFLKKIQLSIPNINSPVQLPFQEACFRTTDQQEDYRGRSRGLALMTWSSNYITDVQSFIDFPMFPKHSATLQTKMKSSFRFEFTTHSTGVWLFGSLIAPETGGYRFALSSSGEAVLRLSRDDEPEKRRNIVSIPLTSDYPSIGQYNKHSSQTSVNVVLHQCQTYFIELLLYSHERSGHIEIVWETPSSLVYEIIPTIYLGPYIDAEDIEYSSESLLIFKDTVKMNGLLDRFVQEKKIGEKQQLGDWHRLPFMNSHHAFHSLPKCSADLNGRSYGQRLQIPKQAGEKKALKVIDQYTFGLVASSKGKYTFNSLHSMEEKIVGGQRATRYLLNLEFNDNMMDIRIRVSEYLFYDNTRMELCTMNAFKWTRDARVTIVAVVRKIEKWSQYFLDHLYDLTDQLRDSRLNVMIVTSKKSKQYVETILGSSNIAWNSHITLVILSQQRLQTIESTLQTIILRIKDPKSIIFYTDTRVMIPTKILEDIRKRTIEGQTLFIPWPENFENGYKENDIVVSPVSGADHPPCFAMFVSDWKRVNSPKSVGKQQEQAGHEWWQEVGNGTLEIYVSKIPNLLYFPGLRERPQQRSPLPVVSTFRNTTHIQKRINHSIPLH